MVNDEKNNDQSVILVIEDKPKIRNIISKRLRDQDVVIELAKNGDEGLNKIRDKNPDLILLDSMLPERSGNEVLSEIREKANRTNLPVIILSARKQSKNIARALENGANDYIKKPIDFKIAKARIKTHLELKKSQEKIRKLAETDHLTKLYNRRVFIEKVREEICEVEKNGLDFSIIMLDLDYFKEVNDQYGHLVGDKVLKETANLLVNQTRAVDVASRYGGEEFCLALPNTNSDEAFELGERLRTKIKTNNFANDVDITCSLGISSFGNESETVEELLRQADKALYISKQQGRDQTTIKY